jgi:NAD(P)-dependent dehydrogenase (short-subunit alcohol dehydrogenase family)
MNRSLDFISKTVVITGGLGLIGSEAAQRFHELGAEVHVLDLMLPEVVSENSKPISKGIIYYQCDVSNIIEVDIAIQKIVKVAGKIDVLFNNAATKSSSPEQFVVDSDQIVVSKVFKEVMNVNVQGLFNVTSSVSKFMKRQGSGSIIHTSSIYGAEMGVDHRIYELHNSTGSTFMSSPAVYNASKAAVVGLTKFFATSLGKFNVRVNSIAPGGVFNDHTAEFRSSYSGRVPMSRMAQVHEIVGPVIFLASDLSTYVNGVNLYIDGGLNAW